MSSPNDIPKNICVFAAGGLAGGRFSEDAYRTGQLIGQNGFGLVYGGLDIGLMGLLAAGAKESGADVTGVLPRPVDDPHFLEEDRQRLISANDQVVGSRSLEQRKLTMLTLSGGVIALAGGLGTFDEIATTLEIGRRSNTSSAAARLVILNTAGYYDGLEQQLKRMADEGFAARDLSRRAFFASTPEEAVEHIKHSIKAHKTFGFKGR